LKLIEDLSYNMDETVGRFIEERKHRKMVKNGFSPFKMLNKDKS